MSYLREKKL